MKNLFLLWSFSVILSAGAAETQTQTADWCKITCPTSVQVGETFAVSLELLGAVDGALKLQPDLHWMKKDGTFGGTYAWGGKSRDIGATRQFKVQFKATAKENLGSIMLNVFLSPDGNWAHRVKNAVGPKIAVIDTGAPVATHKQSWIWIGPSGPLRDHWTEGDDWVVPVEYYIAPEDNEAGGIQLQLSVLGPWVDNPDGKYTTQRAHQGYARVGGSVPAKVGEKTVHEFRMKIPKAMSGEGKVGDALQLMAQFRGWPWSVRAPGPWFTRKDGFFELRSAVPGNLFTYDKPVVLQAVLKPAALNIGAHELRYTVWDTTGTEVAKGSVSLPGTAPVVPIPLELKQRGTFVLEASVEGWETRSTTFARVPNVLALTKGAKTRFGMTHVVSPESDARADALMKISRSLGLTTCRAWCKWSSVEPGPNEFRGLDAWEKGLDLARQNGIDAWLLFEAPPVWAVDGPAKNFSYAAFPFRDDQLRRAITTLGTRFKGKILGWEWLNEIVPGTMSADPVADYTRFCQVATAAAKAADPNVITTLAGGLWPRSFRQSLLAAGIANSVDVLPVHYSDGAGVLEAKRDLAAVGAGRVAVWDNETARGLSTWHMPLREAIQITNQSDWILTHWTDELMAGCEKIVYFGGEGDACGNWTYLWDDLTPRPAATTLAVFTSKMFDARPVGTFTLGAGAQFHLFEKPDGTALLVAGSITNETVALATGAKSVTFTDHQGNEQTFAANALPLSPARHFIEGADPDVVKAYVVAEVPTQVQMLTGRPGECLVRLHNVYARELAGTLQVKGLGKTEPVPFKLAPGQESFVRLELPAATAAASASVIVSFDQAKLPAVEKPFAVSVITPDLLGNLLTNGDFEQAGGWSEHGGKRVAAEGPDLGHGSFVYKFENTAGKYASISQGRNLSGGGRKYLYTAWIKTQDMPAGSNVDFEKNDGTRKSLYDVAVFRSPPTQKDWEVITATFNAPENLKTLAVSPVVNGAGWAMFDNIRLTPHEGTDFAADCPKARGPIKIDANLDDWPRRSPIPLIGRNQLHVTRAGYEWSPQNFSGVAYLQWDNDSLYLAVEVLDNVHAAEGRNEDVLRGDSVILALHPANRLPGQDAKAFAYYISAASPGGGSGQHTLYRPADKSGGLTTGSLAQDSSIYELAIRHANGKTTYELRMPFSQLGGIRPALGAKIGGSLQLNDNDGNGPAATMNWGGGLRPVWHPEEFGVVTFVE